MLGVYGHHEGQGWPGKDLRMCEAQDVIVNAGIRCPFCLKGFTVDQLKDPDATYREVSSWVTGSKSQSPVLRETTGKTAHAECIKKLQDGVAPDQDKLPGIEGDLE